jgi:membrane protease YdiL (CAAX protease family)
MAHTDNSSAVPAVSVYVVFVILAAAANLVFGGPPAVAPAGRAVAGNLLLFVGAVALAGLAAPLVLAARGRLSLPVWPAPGTGDNAAAVLLVIFLFARVEMLVAICAEGRAWGSAALTFFGSAAVNLASVVATIGVLLPALKRRMPPAAAAGLAAAAWVLYHAAQFNVYPQSREISQLPVIAVFGLGYALYYFWSRSLLLTALLQHLIATATFAYHRDYAFGAVGGPFYFSILIVAAFLVAVILKRRLFAAQRFTHF